jgi:hypothetical protein
MNGYLTQKRAFCSGMLAAEPQSRSWGCFGKAELFRSASKQNLMIVALRDLMTASPPVAESGRYRSRF